MLRVLNEIIVESDVQSQFIKGIKYNSMFFIVEYTSILLHRHLFTLQGN